MTNFPSWSNIYLITFKSNKVLDFSFKIISEIKSREKNWIKKTSEENDRKWIERIDNCTAPLWNENVMHFETKSTRIHLHLTLKNSYLPTVVSRLEYTVQIVSKLKLIFTMQLMHEAILVT